MKQFILSTMIFCFAIFSLNCNSKSVPQNVLASGSPEAPAGINKEFLSQHWFHSPEEERRTDNIQVYRPKDFKKYPPTRFRMQYIFQENGDCEWYFLAPDDGHHFKPCIWRIDPDDNDVFHIVKCDSKESFRVIELTKDKLRIDRIEPEIEPEVVRSG